MYSHLVRDRATALRAGGATWAEVSRQTGVAESTLIAWNRDPDALVRRQAGCPLCGNTRLDGAGYAALLGFYLGDGYVSRGSRYFTLRVSCDATQLGVAADVRRCISAVHPTGRIFATARPGTVDIGCNWQHWPCLFPQHGPGRKHERPIVLEPWQEQIVDTHAADFLRGLFHSDGCRVNNWASRQVAGALKRYEYPRWQFVNASADIRELCCRALDRAGIAWRQSNKRVISVSRRADVARLDGLIGQKG